MPTNVGELPALENLVAETQKQLGRVDILVNHAATNPVFGPVQNIEERARDVNMNTNVKPLFFLSKMACGEILEHGEGGSIVNASSTGWASRTRWRGRWSPSPAPRRPSPPGRRSSLIMDGGGIL